MGSLQKGLTTYYGIDNYQFENLTNFKQFSMDYVFCIPCKKPNIEKIVKVWVDSSIEHYEVVKTPVGISLEGSEVTGYKLLISGDISLRVEYIADEPTQTVHTAHTLIPFCSYIVMPVNFNPDSMILPSISIEDVYSEKIDCRSIYNNVTMLLIADIC